MAEGSALVLFSGGQDSTVCLARALERYARVETIGFAHGQRHAVELAGTGEVDGNETAMDDSEGSLYAYGPDAKAMLRAALPIICRSPLAAGGRAYLRYGDADTAAEEDFLLADLCAGRNA